MAKGGSFWSSVPGFLTGLAGVLTAVVTLVTLAFSQGWLGEGGPDGTTSGADGSGGSSESAPELSVEPESLSVRPTLLAAVSRAVTVTNTGDAPFTVDPAEVTGADPERFSVDDGDCAGTSLPSGRSCDLSVTFDPSGVGDAEAKLVVSVNGARAAQEVALDAAGLG